MGSIRAWRVVFGALAELLPLSIGEIANGLTSRPIPATNDRKLTFNAMKHQLFGTSVDRLD
jgi:hypothetical protein